MRRHVAGLIGSWAALGISFLGAGCASSASSVDGPNESAGVQRAAVSVIAGYDLTTPASAVQGLTASTTWTAPSGHSSTDWVGLYQVGAADSAFVASQYAGAGTTGIVTMTLPTTASGQWEFRFFQDNGYTLAANTTGFTVAAATYSLTPPASGTASGTATVSWAAPAGHSSTDWIGLYQVGSSDTSYASTKKVGSLAASGTLDFTLPFSALGDWEFRYFTNNSLTKTATSTSFAVGASTVTLVPNSTSVAGSSTFVNWTASAGHASTDWIAMYVVGGAADSAFYSAKYVGTTATSGGLSFDVPASATALEFRYFVSGTYTLSATGISALATLTYAVTGPASATQGTPVAASWSATAGHDSLDWVGLYQAGASDSAYTAVQYVGSSAATGTLNFRLPDTAAGNWEFRYFTGNSFNKTATSSAIAANAGTYSVSGPPSATRGIAFGANWSAPVDHSTYDWIGLFPAGAPDAGYVATKYVGSTGVTSGTASFMLSASDASGLYEFRYFINNAWTRGGLSSQFTVN
jgi:hypothetical protein